MRHLIGHYLALFPSSLHYRVFIYIIFILLILSRLFIDIIYFFIDLFNNISILLSFLLAF